MNKLPIENQAIECNNNYELLRQTGEPLNIDKAAEKLGYEAEGFPEAIECGSSELSLLLIEVIRELNTAQKKFVPFHSAHEGFAVLKEEVDELWDEVRGKQGALGRAERIKREAIQVVAMGLRLILDCKED